MPPIHRGSPPPESARNISYIVVLGLLLMIVSGYVINRCKMGLRKKSKRKAAALSAAS